MLRSLEPGKSAKLQVSELVRYFWHIPTSSFLMERSQHRALLFAKTSHVLMRFYPAFCTPSVQNDLANTTVVTNLSMCNLCRTYTVFPMPSCLSPLASIFLVAVPGDRGPFGNQMLSLVQMAHHLSAVKTFSRTRVWLVVFWTC